MPSAMHPDAARPPSAQAIHLGEFLNDPAPAGEPGERALQDMRPLHAVRVGLQVQVGSVTLTLGDLLAARAHQVLVLDSQVEDPVDLVLEGRVVARGELVAVDGRFALRITDLPAPLTP